MSKSKWSHSTRSGIDKDYFLKYYYDGVFVIGDNELKQNIKNLTGNMGYFVLITILVIKKKNVSISDLSIN